MAEVKKRTAAKKFVEDWTGKGYEKGESQKFWIQLLGEVLDVEHPAQFISFEDQVHLDHTSFIDGYIPATKVLIEQKSVDKDLNKAIKQSDGSLLNPFQQAKRYITELPLSQHPRWVVTCNFQKFCVYDMERPNGEPQEILLKDLEKEYYRLSFLVDTGNEHLRKEMEVSIKAGEIVGHLYDALLKQYKDSNNEDSLKSLNILCVRLVFCLYAEDAGIFGKHDIFLDYLKQYDASKMRKALIELFEVLNTKPEDRDPYLEDDLKAFPYVNGGLFAQEHIEIPQFTDEIRTLLLEKASANFDWSEISPTIFGAVFESTLNPETRRSGGMHYTSIENIHKVIDPLFLDDLNEEFNTIKNLPQNKTRDKKLEEFQDKIANLNFLDPACGSGNFLTETYILLRKLENEILFELSKGQITMGLVTNPIKVSIKQFYGIEINDFAVTVAKTALWIAESQMMKKTEDIVHMDLDFLPLKTYANIVEGNALRINWENVISKNKLNYIMGNPPFVGARWMSQEQKSDLFNVFGKDWKNSGDLDYVSCWYKKSVDFINQTNISVALVSTNSICQGGSVTNLWKPLFEKGIHINFAYRTFKWDSESNSKAHVHCIIVGFSFNKINGKKKLYSKERMQLVDNINAYLIDAPDMFIESINKPICNVPEIKIGNKPIDGGFYLFEKQEMYDFIKKEPLSEQYFRPWYGAREFINNSPRYCLYLANCNPSDLRKMPEALKRVAAVQEYRSNSTSEGTRKIAATPTKFHVTNIPNGSYIVIPQVSSEQRKYIPIGYMQDGVLCSDKVRILPDGNLYHFGIITSNVHMAWMKTICCRLKSDYSYTINDVYNTFPWCNPTDEQKAKIEKTAQGILDARALYPECSLADLYDELTMPPELRKAHQLNDAAVMEAYGFRTKDEQTGKSRWLTESETVAQLMQMYQELAKDK
ncbi:class I SAM-dependent DNA methyltransferase [bacterium]|nr:class I SAM-dependent DNA methyltransferase [bacterium]